MVNGGHEHDLEEADEAVCGIRIIRLFFFIG